MVKNNQNNLKHLKEVIKQFIINHINEKSNNYIKSSNLHYYFCILHNMNQRSLTSHSFIPLFLNTYEELYSTKLQTKSLRLKKGGNVARYIEGIYLKAASEEITEQLLNSMLSTKQNKIERTAQSMLQKNLSETKEKINSSEQTSNQINSSITSNKVISKKNTARTKTIVPLNLDEYLSYFVPGNEVYSSQVMYELYKLVYKNSPEHLNYINKIEKFKPIFKQEWLKNYPNNPLNLEARIKVAGKTTSIRGIGGLKKIKD